jgi:hypothetical protein
MNMSETPEKKKARLHYDNVFKTAWTDEFHFIKHSRKGNKFALKMQHNAPFWVGKHLKSVGGRRFENLVDYRVNR